MLSVQTDLRHGLGRRPDPSDEERGPLLSQLHDERRQVRLAPQHRPIVQAQRAALQLQAVVNLGGGDTGCTAWDSKFTRSRFRRSYNSSFPL